MTIKEHLKFEPEWYTRIIENSNEKVRLANFIKDTFLRRRVGSLLEVGMGTQPIFSNILSKQVDKYTIIEKESVPAHLITASNVKIIEGDFEAVQIDGKFDVIILSHVIYYFYDLETTIQRTLNLLNRGGKVIFIVNGAVNDYARTKNAFSEMTGITFTYTYDILTESLQNRTYKEYTVPAYITFDRHEELYSYLQLFFDLYPHEYLSNREKIVAWLKDNIKRHKFHMDQKVIAVTN